MEDYSIALGLASKHYFGKVDPTMGEVIAFDGGFEAGAKYTDRKINELKMELENAKLWELQYEKAIGMNKIVLRDANSWHCISTDGLPLSGVSDNDHILFANSKRAISYRWADIKTHIIVVVDTVEFTHWRLLKLPIINDYDR